MKSFLSFFFSFSFFFFLEVLAVCLFIPLSTPLLRSPPLPLLPLLHPRRRPPSEQERLWPPLPLAAENLLLPLLLPLLLLSLLLRRVSSTSASPRASFLSPPLASPSFAREQLSTQRSRLTETSHPRCDRSTFTVPASPCLAAKWSAVIPFRVFPLTLALPSSSSKRAHSAWPFWQAK
jgi:hypothetical protein